MKQALLSVIVLAAVISPASAQIVRSRPIDQATVRIIGVSGTQREEVQTGDETRIQYNPAVSHGSGIVIEPTLIATAAHVVDDLDVIYIRVVGEEQIRSARVAAIDESNDVALLQVAALDAPAFPIPDELIELSPGEILHITGYPLDARQHNPAAASGPLSRQTNDGALELAAALNPGNSGGPVLNAAGQLIAIVSARGRVDRGIQGIALATPISHVRSLRAQVTQGTIPPAPSTLDWLIDEDADVPAEATAFSPLFAALAAHDHWRSVVRRLFDFRAPRFNALPPNAQQQVRMRMTMARQALAIAATDSELTEDYHLEELQAQLNAFMPSGATRISMGSTTSELGSPGAPASAARRARLVVRGPGGEGDQTRFAPPEWRRVNFRLGFEYIWATNDHESYFDATGRAIDPGYGVSFSSAVLIDIFQATRIDVFAGINLGGTVWEYDGAAFSASLDLGLRVRSSPLLKSFFVEAAWAPIIYRTDEHNFAVNANSEGFMELLNARLLTGYQFGSVGLAAQLRVRARPVADDYYGVGRAFSHSIRVALGLFVTVNL